MNIAFSPYYHKIYMYMYFIKMYISPYFRKISSVALRYRWKKPPPAPRTKILKLFVNVSPHFEGLLKTLSQKCMRFNFGAENNVRNLRLL